MSSSIAIPGPSANAGYHHQSPKGAGSSSNSPYSSSPSCSPPSSSRKDKAVHTRRPSLLTGPPTKCGLGYCPNNVPTALSKVFNRSPLTAPKGSAISKQECTVINIGDPEGPPRLISYLSSSQGFAWNPEIFLPSYIDCDYVPLENRRDPVHEILLSDEESKNLLPQ
ncbi:Fc.00g028280.m01.CDS01 [Cosmosporella sp. VM-42]